jgi:hypothetical protein
MNKIWVKKTIQFLENKIRKATSYEVVKSRLYYRLYSSDLLSNRIEYIDGK